MRSAAAMVETIGNSADSTAAQNVAKATRRKKAGNVTGELATLSDKFSAIYGEVGGCACMHLCLAISMLRRAPREK